MSHACRHVFLVTWDAPKMLSTSVPATCQTKQKKVPRTDRQTLDTRHFQTMTSHLNMHESPWVLASDLDLRDVRCKMKDDGWQIEDVDVPQYTAQVFDMKNVFNCCDLRHVSITDWVFCLPIACLTITIHCSDVIAYVHVMLQTFLRLIQNSTSFCYKFADVITVHIHRLRANTGSEDRWWDID